jgi:hypothetical protein
MGLIRKLAAALFMLCIASAHAMNTPPHIQNEISNARLSGQGNLRWFGLKIYDAQLWVDEQGYQPNAPASSKFALNLVYARDLYGDHIARTSIDEIRKLGFGTKEQHEVWLIRMKSLFPDVQEGSQISGINLPGHGARFYLNGNLLGEIADTEFARAFFAIWLDPRTSASSLRSSLLSSAQ